MRERYGDEFEASMGAEAIQELLKDCLLYTSAPNNRCKGTGRYSKGQNRPPPPWDVWRRP